jgi:hypothetical protein
MKLKPRFQFEKRDFVFFALTLIKPLTSACPREPSLGRGRTKPRALDAR